MHILTIYDHRTRINYTPADGRTVAVANAASAFGLEMRHNRSGALVLFPTDSINEKATSAVRMARGRLLKTMFKHSRNALRRHRLIRKLCEVIETFTLHRFAEYRIYNLLATHRISSMLKTQKSIRAEPVISAIGWSVRAPIDSTCRIDCRSRFLLPDLVLPRPVSTTARQVAAGSRLTHRHPAPDDSGNR